MPPVQGPRLAAAPPAADPVLGLPRPLVWVKGQGLGGRGGCGGVAASPEAQQGQRGLRRLAMRLGLGCTLPFGFLIFKMRVAKGNRSGQESILLPQPDSARLFLPLIPLKTTPAAEQ